MKLIIPLYIEKELEKLGISIRSFVLFLKNTALGSAKLIEICAPLPDTKVYKAYLDGNQRAVLFCVQIKGIIYPAYVGNKQDSIAKNITVSIVRKNAEQWQLKVLTDIQNKHYKIRHY
ncbi:hypothetical protein COU00_00740 [Candidatus Falkowbacteria bacterium CG10_big_fil_rev_8_21_14_0_10_43_11]|uniref:Uncharacterized protein n=1 Tax=Candidatus Falkowbacteria bacterium CG10_big_fil_rev_8_21_14_0_10_43_11 TaxID=1974568 RepID=A0A2M6WMU3_9BACT|nr:MAG: hypothetical protein COU00_00740 [Candidatus Falkowbacteria bacterium CG10_big_fil_rev_8_21_14_0_10_43_11]